MKIFSTKNLLLWNPKFGFERTNANLLWDFFKDFIAQIKFLITTQVLITQEAN